MQAAGWEGRALLGERLAGHRLDAPADRERVLELLLDDHDTAVTYRTALALFERRDRLGLELIVTALIKADEDTDQWLGDAMAEFRARSFGADDEFLRLTLGEMTYSPNPGIRESAQRWLLDVSR